MIKSLILSITLLVAVVFQGKAMHIDGTATIPGTGCQIHVVGDAEFGVWPPRLSSFTGTATFSGNGCPFTGTINVIYHCFVMYDESGTIITQVVVDNSNDPNVAYTMNNDPDVQGALVDFYNSINNSNQ